VLPGCVLCPGKLKESRWVGLPRVGLSRLGHLPFSLHAWTQRARASSERVSSRATMGRSSLRLHCSSCARLDRREPQTTLKTPTMSATPAAVKAAQVARFTYDSLALADVTWPDNLADKAPAPLTSCT
jgi:hypothetical protein